MTAPATDPRAGLHFIHRTLYALDGGCDGTEGGGSAVETLRDFTALLAALTDCEARVDLDACGLREALTGMAVKAQDAADRIKDAHKAINLVARVGAGRVWLGNGEAEKAAALVSEAADA